MGVFLQAEKKRYIEWKASTKHISEAAKKDGIYPKNKASGRTHPFCLAEAYADENLFAPIRRHALDYFSNKGIPWHDGADGRPSNHLCDSQVCCVNFLFPFMDNPEALVCLLRPYFPEIRSILPMENGPTQSYLSFEW